ncbi:hypothetical protein Pla123a_04740 [Posidoniimonas polymericola]|uniref:Uncharacterized protein n=1 Tax=Posidoniimonas polymericola TaxID=2528002 RepID=A0A5C5ZF30_9BACT|nr:hypothetical protein [Posidoniimonas polymericola]TWT85667.1 hypothetical protein Pla123a_04740 [Posidoniimonas polymericola]
MRSRTSIAIFALLIASTAVADDAPAPIEPPTAELRAAFSLAPHYQKAVVVEGFPIVASAKVSDAALHEAAHTVCQMLGSRPDILKKLAENRIRLAVMAASEVTTDLPEHSDLTPASYWNRRARGLGATRQRPAVSCGEENLLHLAGDPYRTESILVHEFAHAIHQMAVNDLDPTFDNRLQAAYRASLDNGLWKGMYAAENKDEYFAEAVQSWFDTNRENDSVHNHVNTRAELSEYDPAAAALVREVFGDSQWRYVRADEPHLKGFDRAGRRFTAWRSGE